MVVPLLAVAIATVMPADVGAAPVRDGTTTLTLDPVLRRALAAGPVRVTGTGGTVLSGTRLRLPVHDGDAEPATSTASLAHRGAVRFAPRPGATGRAVRWSAVAIQGRRRWRLMARLDDGSGGNATVATAERDARMRGSATVVASRAVRFRLTAAGARSLRRAGASGVRAGASLGRLAVRVRVTTPPVGVPVPGAVTLTGGSAVIALDLGTLGTLQANGIRFQLLAESDGTPNAAVFPVTGGALEPGGRRGAVQLGGAFVVLHQERQLLGWAQPRLELGPPPVMTGAGNGGTVTTFTADLSAANVARTPTGVAANGIELRLAPRLVEAFNALAGRSIVSEASRFGTLRLDATSD